MPSSQQAAPIAAPSIPSITPANMPSPAASPVVTTEYMSAVANSIQKEKLEDQVKHQNAVQKTLELALKAKEVEDKKKEAL